MWDSKHWHRRLSEEYNSTPEKSTEIWENYVTELYDRPDRPVRP